MSTRARIAEGSPRPMMDEPPHTGWGLDGVPGGAWPWRQLGRQAASRGDYAAALHAFDEALACHQREGGKAAFECELRIERSRAHMCLGQRDAAQVELLLAAMGPDQGLAHKAQSLLMGLVNIPR